VTIAYIGDGNNVCNSFIAAAPMLGYHLSIATPQGYEPEQSYLAKAQTVNLTHDPYTAVKGADIIYTDVWASMGQEEEAAERKEIFMPYQINSRLLKAASPGCLVMHCLPAHRGEEITDEVIDGPQSIVFDQAENRLHVQKAIMTWLVERA
jgi:ornithine carbamoyltransferase